MRVFGEPATAPRMLLLNEVRFEAGGIFRLDRPLFLMPGDQVAMDEGRLVVRRATGSVEHLSGERAPWCRRWQLV